MRLAVYAFGALMLILILAAIVADYLENDEQD